MRTAQPSSDDARWIAIKRSRLHLVLMSTLALLAAAMMFIVAASDDTWLPRPLAWVLLAACVGGAALEFRRALRPSPRTVVSLYLLELDADDPTHAPVLGIRVRHADTSEEQGTVAANAFVTPWFASIPYRLRAEAGWRRYWQRFWPRLVPLWRDALDADDFREIRVRLRWH
jgi:hypothetical protein